MEIDDFQANLIAQSGVHLRVRRAAPQDEARIEDFFAHVTPEDLSFRFLSGMKEVSHERLQAMTRADDPAIINFLAFSSEDTLVAVGALAIDEGSLRGEVALSVRADHKHLGISWTLLSHVAQFAQNHHLQSIELSKTAPIAPPSNFARVGISDNAVPRRSDIGPGPAQSIAWQIRQPPHDPPDRHSVASPSDQGIGDRTGASGQGGGQCQTTPIRYWRGDDGKPQPPNRI